MEKLNLEKDMLIGQNGGSNIVTKQYLTPESMKKQEVTLKLLKIENKISQERTDLGPHDMLIGHIGGRNKVEKPNFPGELLKGKADPEVNIKPFEATQVKNKMCQKRQSREDHRPEEMFIRQVEANYKAPKLNLPVVSVLKKKPEVSIDLQKTSEAENKMCLICNRNISEGSLQDHLIIEHRIKVLGIKHQSMPQK